MTDETHHGGCACGRVRFVVTGALSDVVACHCQTCRRISGNYWAATRAAWTNLQIEDDTALRWYASSADAGRAFCSHCGSPLFFRETGAPKVSISPGALDAPSDLTTTAHIFCVEAGDYYRIPDEGVRYPGSEVKD